MWRHVAMGTIFILQITKRWETYQLSSLESDNDAEKEKVWIILDFVFMGFLRLTSPSFPHGITDESDDVVKDESDFTKPLIVLGIQQLCHMHSASEARKKA